jgi:hypothetical protein
MSNIINGELLERAADLIDYFTGTQNADVLQRLIDTNDLEALYHYVNVGEQIRFENEYRPEEVARA